MGETNNDILNAAHKHEDAAHSSGDVGWMLLAVRKDTAAALAGTDGDYIPLIVDSSGRLWVNAGAGTVTANQGTAGAASWPTTEQEAFVAGHERLALAGASAALTVPGTARKALIAAEGGDVRYAPTGTASASSPGYIPAGGIVKIPPPAAVYGATGSYANVVYLA